MRLPRKSQSQEPMHEGQGQTKGPAFTHSRTGLLRGALLPEPVEGQKPGTRTCRLSSWSSRRASSRDRSTSCSEARSSPASLATDTRASSRRASFCSLSSLASFKLQGRDCPQTVVLCSRLALGLNWSGPILPRSVSACPHTWLSLH